MLVLSRKVGERVRIVCPDGTEVWVTFAQLKKRQIRLGFQAPESVIIEREELVPIHQRPTAAAS